MSLSRREFMKLCTGTVAGLGVSQIFHPGFVSALKEAAKKAPVIWIQGQGCTGCSVSLLNSVSPDIKQLLLEIISLEFHPTVMVSEGETALEHMYKVAEKFKGQFFLAVEGAIPVAANGKYCIVGEIGHKEKSMVDVTLELGKMAAATVAIGTCAAYGGIPAAKGSQTGATSVGDLFKKNGVKTPVVNIPGCPPHPDWIVGTIAFALKNVADLGLAKGLGEVVKILDDKGRPTPFFGKNIHSNCPYLKHYDSSKFSKIFTDKDGCRLELGCKGPNTNADCYQRKWNGGLNWCVENAVCIGCVEPGFPDEMSPFYEAM